MKYRYIYVIYLTEGSLKGKYYYGQHTTTNLFDGYKGSGKIIKDYYKKYPNAWNKIILGFYNTKEELNKAEKNIINLNITNNACLNISSGGTGGDNYTYNPNKSEICEKLKGKTPWMKGKKHTDKSKNLMSETRKGKPTWNKGLKTPEETRKKQSEAHKGQTSIRKGKHLTSEQKKNISDKTKEGMNDEAREKIRQAHLGKKISNEHKEKIRQSRLGKHRVYDDLITKKYHYE